MTTPPSGNFDDHRMTRAGGWIGGALLIALGVLLLLQNLTGFYINNWWALFILLPAAGAFGRAWNTFRQAGGRLTGEVRGSLFGGVILSLVAATFLLGLSWAILGPVLILLAGASLILNAVLPREGEDRD